MASNITRPRSTSVIQISVTSAKGGAGSKPSRSFSRNSRPAIAAASARGTMPKRPDAFADCRAIAILLIQVSAYADIGLRRAARRSLASGKPVQHSIERRVEASGIGVPEYFLDMALRARPGWTCRAQRHAAGIGQVQVARPPVAGVGPHDHVSVAHERAHVAGQRARIHDELLG